VAGDDDRRRCRFVGDGRWPTATTCSPPTRWYDAGVGDHPEVASFDEVDALLP